jgi:hypothetical protein
MRILFFTLLLYHVALSTDDHSVEVNGTIGTIRFVMLSNNTVSCEADFNATGVAEYELGSVQLNLFDNTGSGGGKVYMNNYQYIENTWRAVLPGQTSEQVRLEIYSSLDTSGSPISDTINPVLLDTTGTDVEDEKFTLTFYAVDDVNNSTLDGTFYGAFEFYWTDL